MKNNWARENIRERERGEEEPKGRNPYEKNENIFHQKNISGVMMMIIAVTWKSQDWSRALSWQDIYRQFLTFWSLMMEKKIYKKPRKTVIKLLMDSLIIHWRENKKSNSEIGSNERWSVKLCNENIVEINHVGKFFFQTTIIFWEGNPYNWKIRFISREIAKGVFFSRNHNA